MNGRREPVQGDLLAQEGMERAEAGADIDWLRNCKAVVWELILAGQPFTTDIVWFRLEARGVSTKEGRALGSVMRAAASAGFIAQTGQYVKTTRPEAHSRPIPCWMPTGKTKESAA